MAKVRENQLVEGIFTSKELCEMIGYKYETFKNDKGKRCISKLQAICTVEKTGTGRGTKYIVSNIKDIEFDVNKRKSRKVEYKTMSDLFKAPIIQLLTSKEDGIFTGTFDNWLVYTSLVQKGFKFKNKKFLDNNKSLSFSENDFFNIEGKSLHHNFIQALEKLRKKKDILWYKVRMVVEKEIAKDKEIEKHRCISNEPELAKLRDFEAEFNKKYNIKDRNDLVYGNPEEGTKRNTELLKEYDKELRQVLYDEFGYKYTYTAYMVVLKNNSIENKNKLRKKYCDDFNIDLIKDDIYQYRLKKAELRQKRTKKEIDDKIKSSQGFGDIESLILMQETDIRQLQYEEKYVEKWLQLYKKYIYRYDI